MANSEIERRLTVSDTSIEYRDVGNGEKRPVIVGYAAVFNSESRNLGGFVEVIHPNAFDEVLASNPDVIGVYNHSKDKLLARSANGTLKLRPDSYGLRYEMGPLPKTQTADEVAELVAGGYVTGSSFAFSVKNTGHERGDSWSMTSSGLRRREVRSIGKLEDVGPVVRPAFEAASVVVSRRAIEMALGDAYRPNQTMANAARKGLNACRGRDDVDQVLMSIAEHIVAREIVSVEEVEYLANVHERCLEARAEDWTGSPAWVEWKLAGGEAGAKWAMKRRVVEDEERTAGDKSQSTPAPKEDQISGSDKNRQGSAKNASGRIKVSDSTRTALKTKVADHNDAMAKADKPAWSKATVGQLLAVYRRGSGAYSTSHRPGVSRGAWAMARVNAYLYLLRNGKPKDAKYVTDNDLLPSDHPKASSERSIDAEIEERAEVNLKPTAGMAAAARRGLRLHEEGKSGDGLKPETVARANKLAARENMNEDWVREMNAWFARHESASKSPGWDTPGAEKPGFVAWLLWGGNAAKRFSAAKVAQMDRQESRSMGENVTPPKRALYKALEDIAEVNGAFPPADVHYMPNSPFLAQGMRCANCIFYEGGGGCEIVQGGVSPEGLCQLHIIPEATMSESESESREGATATVDEAQPHQQDAAASQVTVAESNSVPAAEPDPVEALLVKAAELNAAVLRTRLRTM